MLGRRDIILNRQGLCSHSASILGDEKGWAERANVLGVRMVYSEKLLDRKCSKRHFEGYFRCHKGS